MQLCNIGYSDKDRVVDVGRLTVAEEMTFSAMELQNYQCFSSLSKSVYIHNCDSITDVSCFRTLQSVTFEWCSNITDVSSLSDVHELSFSYCQGITDVSTLGRVYSLGLSVCHNITDVSALGKVHTLTMNGCSRLTDISSLGNVPILNLNYCRGVTNVSRLTNVLELHLESFQGNNLEGLESLEKLFLNYTDSITDISMLQAAKELHVASCPKITDFHGLNNLQILEVGHGGESAAGPLKISSGMEIFKCLLELQANYVNFFEDKRDLDNFSDSFLSLTDFPNVQNLTLENCVFSQFPTTFTHLHSLSLNYCSGFSVLPGLASLDSLEVFDCKQLAELHLFGDGEEKYPISSVTVESCGELQSLRISRKISQLKIFHCRKLSELIIECQVNFLRVRQCPRLKEVSPSAPILYSDWKQVVCGRKVVKVEDKDQDAEELQGIW
jgi:hypothetical protein